MMARLPANTSRFPLPEPAMSRITRGALTGLCVLFAMAALPAATPAELTPPAAPPTVLVAGATGSIGRFVVQKLLARGVHVRGLTRKPDEARAELPAVEWVGGDLREPDSLKDVDAIIFAAGSKSWQDPTNTPELVDFGGVAALADLGLAAGCRQFVLISSAGVTQDTSGMSAHLQNVLKWKGKAEEHLRRSGLPYTILRPLGMWDEPGGQLGIALLQGDVVHASVSISREDLAAVAVECAFNPDARNKTMELFNAATFELDSWKTDLKRQRADP